MKPQDILPEANKYNLEPAVLWALVLTESNGSGFLKPPYSEHVTILFEGHILWKQLLQRGISPAPLAAARPDLCFRKWTKKYYKGGYSEHLRRNQVVEWAQLHDHLKWESYKKASMESCSWGLFQILGLHYSICGFQNVYEFKDHLQLSETAHVETALRFIKGNGLLDDLRRRDWINFTRYYNGPGQIPIYSVRMQANYLRAKKLF